MKKIFFENGVWKGFEAPEVPHVQVSANKEAIVMRNYEKAYAAARAAALPILNSEIITTDQVPGEPGKPYSSNNDYDWPGEWMVDKCWDPSGIVLSLPAKETGKTAEEILKLYPALTKTITCISDVEQASIEQAMQEYSDQQLAAFKEKFKKTIKEDYDQGDLFYPANIIQIIDEL